MCITRFCWVAALCALLLLSLSACASMTPQPYTDEEMAQDRVITEAVEQALGGYAAKVSVTTQRRVVYLRGSLVDRNELDAIMRRVRSVRGIKFIHDDFDVQWNRRGSFLRYWDR